jgi:hypothetical protein
VRCILLVAVFPSNALPTPCAVSPSNVYNVKIYLDVSTTTNLEGIQAHIKEILGS